MEVSVKSGSLEELAHEATLVFVGTKKNKDSVKTKAEDKIKIKNLKTKHYL